MTVIIRINVQKDCDTETEENGMKDENYNIKEIYIKAADKNRFIDFLRFCSERLNKGDSVQAIWRDFQESGR